MTTCTSRAAWLNLLRRLHFYIGLFIGPFIFVAALTGTLYVATPQLENWLYHDALHGLAEDSAAAQRQIAVAEEATGAICGCWRCVRRLRWARPRALCLPIRVSESRNPGLFCRSDRAAGEGRYDGLRHQRHPAAAPVD